jgi:diguanylate cyclase (GGDEF)-like protein/PAS domain S-box-containing protein
MFVAALSAGIAGAGLTALVMGRHYRRLRRAMQDVQARELQLQAAHSQLESHAADLERHVSDVEEARTRIESQAADYVGLMEELALAQAATQRAHGDLQLKEEQLRRMTDSLPALVADVDASGCYRYCNLRFLDFMDLLAADILGRHVSEVLGEEAAAALQADRDRVMAGEEVSFRRAMNSHGEIRQLEGKCIPQVDATGAVGGFYVAAWDVTEQYRREVELNREVTTDALTGLLNRRAVLEALAELARSIATGPTSGAVLFLDIDHFKQINDTLGHAAGDQLLKIFAQRLRGAVRGSDKVARLGGDEFVVLLLDVGVAENAEKVAQKILDRMRDAVGLDSRSIEIGTSIGIAHCVGQQVTAEFLLQEADAALYDAKKAGRGTYRLRHIKPSIELV